MVVVLIVAILAAIALPAYDKYVTRSELTEAFNNLSAFHAKMEQYFQDYRNYGTVPDCADGNFPPSKYFSYQCISATDVNGVPTYQIKATGSTGRTNGYEYIIDQDGNRATSQFNGVASTATCWATRDASSCD
jgi:type IV pilus assembly protein PilE